MLYRNRGRRWSDTVIFLTHTVRGDTLPEVCESGSHPGPGKVRRWPFLEFVNVGDRLELTLRALCFPCKTSRTQQTSMLKQERRTTGGSDYQHAGGTRNEGAVISLSHSYPTPSTLGEGCF